MSFASAQGYLPLSIEDMFEVIRANVNTQFGTSYTTDTFVGTNFYKYFYALIQRLQENEVKTSEIFLRMQEYFNITNEKVQRPNTTAPGIYDYFKSKGYFVSTKPPEDADAGKAFICVDVSDNHARGTVEITSYGNLVSGTADTVTIGTTDFTAQSSPAIAGDATFQADISNEATALSLASQIRHHVDTRDLVEVWVVDALVYIRAKAAGTTGNSIALAYTDNDANVGAIVSDTTLLGGRALETGEKDYDVARLEICNIIKSCIVAGVVSQGTEFLELTLTNGQSFTFKYNLPDKIPILIRLTTTLSENNEFTVLSPDDQKQKLFDNISAKYKLGKNFEPQRYFSVVDAPWASSVLLEYSTDGGFSYTSDVFDSDYDQVLTFDLTDIEIVED